MVEIKRVQNRLLEMAKATIEILDRHLIPYSLAFGTLLGAIRHEGFIPWDDDLDLWLFDDTYDEAIHYLRNELPSRFFIEDRETEPLYFHAWAHVKDLGSVAACDAYPQDGSYSHKGLFLDLYRLYCMDINDVPRFRIEENRKYIMRRKELNLFDEAEHQKRLDRLNEELKIANDTVRVQNRDVLAMPSAAKWILEIKDVFPLAKTTFEGHSLSVPANASAVLKMLYGNYMKLPPEEKRVQHYSDVQFVFVDEN